MLSAMLAVYVSFFVLFDLGFSCPAGLLPWQNNCYYISYNRMKWSDAESFCGRGDGGGHLASIENAIETNFAIDQLISMDGADNVWNGGNNLEDGSTWQWSDGKSFTYTKWKAGPRPKKEWFRVEFVSGYPNNAGDNQCIVMDKDNGQWSNENCHQPRRFICKFPNFSNLASTTPPMRCPSCKPGYEMHQEFCYKVFHLQATWNTAESACLQEGGHLASIHSVDENNYIRGLVLTQPEDSSSDRCDYGPWLWIGMTDPLQNLNNIWSDGSNVTITNWAPGYPDLTSCDSGIHCGYMAYSSRWQGIWYSTACTMHQAFFICKMAVQ